MTNENLLKYSTTDWLIYNVYVFFLLSTFQWKYRKMILKNIEVTFLWNECKSMLCFCFTCGWERTLVSFSWKSECNNCNWQQMFVGWWYRLEEVWHPTYAFYMQCYFEKQTKLSNKLYQILSAFVSLHQQHCMFREKNLYKGYTFPFIFLSNSILVAL